MLAFLPDMFPKQRVKWCRFSKIAGQLGNIISVGKLWVMGAGLSKFFCIWSQMLDFILASSQFLLETDAEL